MYAIKFSASGQGSNWNQLDIIESKPIKSFPYQGSFYHVLEGKDGLETFPSFDCFETKGELIEALKNRFDGWSSLSFMLEKLESASGKDLAEGWFDVMNQPKNGLYDVSWSQPN